MKRYIIYKCTSPSGKVYIGQTNRTLTIRWKEHMKLARTGGNLPISRAIRYHTPEKFTVEPIVEGIPDYMANAFEAYWINFYNSIKVGYNCVEGGQGTKGYKHSEHTKRLLSEKSKGNKSALGHKLSDKAKKKISNANKGNTYTLGKSHSKESRKKMSESATGRKLSKYTKKKIATAVKGRKHTKEAKEKMSEFAKKFRINENHSRATSVVCITTGEEFLTIKAAALAKGIDPSSIGKCCKNKLKTAGGYSWKYKNK